jgi:luciferase family oxidoreductase group 1
LPYAFASHFAPAQMMEAIQIYRENFRPSSNLAVPYVMLGVNVVAADTDEEARRLLTSLQQAFVNLRRGHPGLLPPPVEKFEQQLEPFERMQLDQVLAASVVGSPESVRRGLEQFIARTGADEVIIAAQVFDHGARLRSYEITAAARDQLKQSA